MKKTLLFIVLSFSMGQIFAQDASIWQVKDALRISELKRNRTNNVCEGELYFGLDLKEFQKSLVGAHDKFSNLPGIAISLPNSEGVLETYMVWENSNFEPSLQEKYPDIRSYVGKGVSDKFATLNLSVSPQGIQTLVFRADTGTEFIEAYDKEATTYVLFNSNKRISGRLPFNCNTTDVAATADLANKFAKTTLSENAKYKTFRLAISCTAEYANYFGATSSANVGLVLAAMNATMTRVNGVMEKDLAVHLNLIATNNQVIYYNSATDPYDDAFRGTGNDPANNYQSTWNNQLQLTLTSVLGNSAYDIGHLFGASGGGGNAGCIGCVCVSGSKGSAYTSPSDGNPSGDTFDIDFVVHEMGHQLGANHTFTYAYEGSDVQVEPGSGSTIMAYAGVADNGTNLAYNVQAHSDALFCYKSINQIQSNLAISTASCAVTTALTNINATPTASGGGSFTIPISTAFKLTGSGTDADAGDVLTYCWEQSNLGTVDTTDSASRVLGTKAVGPNFRIFSASSSTSRYFPELSKVFAGNIVVTTASDANWESCSSVARALNFNFTVRDNHAGVGQTKTASATVTVVNTAGPFKVTSQATTGISYASGSTQTVTWNVANTSILTGSSTVDILLTTNSATNNGNGAVFTTLATGLPNNGTATITLPNISPASTNCRIMIKPSANVFFAVNSRNFTIQASLNTDDFAFSNLSIYPNPNKGNFNIQFTNNSPNNEVVKVIVHDMRGRIILENNFESNDNFNQNIQLNDAQAGIYLLTITDGLSTETKKIIVE